MVTDTRPKPNPFSPPERVPLAYFNGRAVVRALRSGYVDLGFEDDRWESIVGWRLSADEADALAATLAGAAQTSREGGAA